MPLSECPDGKRSLLFDGADPGSGEAAVSGSLVIVGLGPGSIDLLTPAAARALQAATDLVGYGPYLDRIPETSFRSAPSCVRTIVSRSSARVTRSRSPPKATRSRSSRAAIPAYSRWRRRSSKRSKPAIPPWRELDIHVEPGITAMLAAAAEVGAPLGADFCAISLSDNLKSWETIERRLRAAAEGDFVIALYNPASRARPHQLGRAFDLLRATKSPQTIVLFVRRLRRPKRASSSRPWLKPIQRLPICARWSSLAPRQRGSYPANRAAALGLYAACRTRGWRDERAAVRASLAASSAFSTACPCGLCGRAIITTGMPSWRAASILA